MAARPVSPKPATASPPRTKTALIEPEQAFVDPLADVPLLGPVTDRFEIQPGDITLITVGSIEVVIHSSDGEGETKPTTPPGGRQGRGPRTRPSDRNPAGTDLHCRRAFIFDAETDGAGPIATHRGDRRPDHRPPGTDKGIAASPNKAIIARRCWNDLCKNGGKGCNFALSECGTWRYLRCIDPRNQALQSSANRAPSSPTVSWSVAAAHMKVAPTTTSL